MNKLHSLSLCCCRPEVHRNSTVSIPPFLHLDLLYLFIAIYSCFSLLRYLPLFLLSCYQTKISCQTTTLEEAMAVAMCQSAPALPHAQSASACAAAAVNERFYKFGTPSPPSLQQPSPPVTEYSYRSELEDSGFHSDEEIQKVRQNKCLCVCGGSSS